MEREVLRPLGMTGSSYSWRPEYADLMATGYEMDGTPVDPYVYPARASGGLLVDLDDLARFAVTGMTSGRTGGPTVLSEESMNAIYAPRVPIPGLYGVVADSYGYGHFLENLSDGRHAVFHGGQGHGWMTHFHSVPESGEGIVILTNSQRSWPFIAAVLSDWASWSGVGTVRFAVITSATRIFRAAIALVALVASVQLLRIVLGLRAGQRRWGPVNGGRPVVRGTLFLTGTFFVGFVAWRVSLPYVDEASIFSSTAPWAAAALVYFGLVLIASAIIAPSACPALEAADPTSCSP